MRIHQLLPCLHYGDAIGNHALALKDLLRRWGHTSEIYAEDIHPRLVLEGRPIAEFAPTEADVTILHYAFRSQASDAFERAAGKRVLIYHNVTPHEFFEPYHAEACRLTKEAREFLGHFRDKVDLCMGDSAYNCAELTELGFPAARVVPLLLDFGDFERTAPASDVLARFDDGWTNFLFVGRVAPNKRHEDLIRLFARYHRFVDPRSRLLLVGGHAGMERYMLMLQTLADELGVAEHVHFSGHTRFDELVAYYRVADAFVCMSEHEGFCVPLLEAMHQSLPVLAYGATAIPETMGEAGVLARQKHPPALAEMLHLLVHDEALRARVIERQHQRLADFAPEAIAARFHACLAELGVA